MALKSIDYPETCTKMSWDDWFTFTAIKNYKWQLKRAEIRSTVGLTGSHPPGIQKKTNIRLAFCWCPVERVWHPQNRKYLSSFSDSQHQFFRLHSDGAADVNRNHFPSSSTVLNGKEEESIQFPSSSRYITVCKLSELFKYLFITKFIYYLFIMKINSASKRIHVFI